MQALAKPKIRLDGQRVLCVMPQFFGYEREIQAEMEGRGATVDWLPDRPFTAPMLRALTTRLPGLVLPIADQIYADRLRSFAARRYDEILVINGQTLSRRSLMGLRTAYPDARFTIYMWDSIKNRAHVRGNLRLFDRAFTFDPDDAVFYGMQLRPLFYGHGFSAAGSSVPKSYHVSFVGTAHSDRFAIISRVKSCLPNHVNAYWYLYLQAPWVFNYYRLTRSDMRSAKRSDFHFTPLQKEAIQRVFAASQSILDVEHPQQKGLTMRTFEALGAGKKLVTTNAAIRDCELYCEDNVCVIDRASPSIPAEFLETAFRPLSSSISARYSISGWLDELLGP